LKKTAKFIGIGAALLLLLVQLYQPERTNPPVDASRTLQARVEVPAEVDAIFRRSCFDCHSHATRWPWYSYVAPTSWLVAGDVEEARHEMNLSDWAAFDAKKADQKLEAICEEVTEGAMPLPSYTMIHWDAKLSSAEVETLCRWTNATRKQLASSGSD